MKDFTPSTAKNPVKSNKGCNFNATQYDTEKTPMKASKIRSLIASQTNDYTIVCDWLEVFCQSEDFSSYITSLGLSQSQPEQTYKITEKYKLRYSGHGTQLYKHLFTLIIDNQEFAIIQSNPRKLVGKMTDWVMSIKVLNQHLYTIFFADTLLQALEDLKITFLNITRLDIALDNCNHVLDFMNEYVQQNKENQAIIHAGKTDISFKKMNNFLEFQSIQIGSGNSEKYLIMYNKAGELHKSNKEYIKDFWESNTHNINEKQVIRCELRLKSKEIKRFTNLTIKDLEQEEILKQIFQKCTTKLLDFRYNDNKNVSRCESISLINLDKVSCKLLHEKITYTTSDTYKAKLSIHQIFKIFCTVNLLDAEFAHLDSTLDFYLKKYNLKKWYKARLPYWKDKYEARY